MDLNPCNMCKSTNIVWKGHGDLEMTYFCSDCKLSVIEPFGNHGEAREAWNKLNKPALNPCECGSTNLEVVESHVAGYSYISCECGRESVRSNSLTNLTNFWNHKNKPDSGLNRKVPVLDLERDLRAMAAFGEALAESARILKAFTEIYLEDTKNAKDRSN